MPRSASGLGNEFLWFVARFNDHEGDGFPYFVAFNGKNLVEPSYARIVINETSERKSKDGSEAAFGKLFPC